MTNGVNFLSRVERAKHYFEAMRFALNGSWEEALERYGESDDRIVYGLVLVHPTWLDGFTAGLYDIRGPRTFKFGAQSESCQAPLIWGYECPGTPMEIDHMFPFALGGPTRADNGLILCREHNRVKGHDVHLLPWDSYTFPWLGEQIGRVKARLQ